MICAAAKGKRQISHPLSGLPASSRYPDSAVMDAVRKGRPGSSEYETVSW